MLQIRNDLSTYLEMLGADLELFSSIVLVHRLIKTTCVLFPYQCFPLTRSTHVLQEVQISEPIIVLVKKVGAN